MFSEYCHFLRASKGVGSSFIWNGIFEAKETLKKGFRWVIGDGKEVIAVQDPWLRRKRNFRVEDSHTYQGRNETVADLFIEGTKQWNVELIRSQFCDEDVKAILATPIPQGSNCDRVAWSVSTNGHFDVKSGYKFWLNENSRLQNIPQSMGWSKFWKVNIPHKIRVFLWRFCRNTIPVRNRLKAKGVQLPILCPMCNRDVEHLLHVFFDCQYASQCWQHVGLQYDMHEVQSAPEWLLNRITEGNSKEVVKVATVLWGIWYGRNKLVWDSKTIAPSIIMDWSSRSIAEWQQVQENRKIRGRGMVNRASRETAKWKPPKAGQLKINVDASLSQDTDSFALGMVIRDDKGEFIEGKVIRLQYVESAVEAETKGVLEALRWAVFKGLQNVCVETDSLLTVKAIQSQEIIVFEIGYDIQECKNILQEYPNFSVEFVQRQANKVAHELARYPCLIGCFHLLSSPPVMLLETIMLDALF